MKHWIYILLFISSLLDAQVLESYPKNQDFYIGGVEKFYQDFQNVLVEKQLKPCENRNEIVVFSLIVYPDSTIKYVKEMDESVLNANKCTFDLAKNTIKSLKDWIPAEVNGKKVPAIAKFIFYPNDFFENFSTNYNPEKHITPAEFPGGIKEFRKKFFQRYDVRGFNYSNDFKIAISFMIDRNGNAMVTNFDIPIENQDYLKMVMDAIEGIKTKWKPATYKGLPIESFFKFPLSVNSH